MGKRLMLLCLCLAGLVAVLIALLWGFVAALAGSERARRVAVGADQMLNAALGGSEDETISSRAGKGAARGIWHWCLLCRLLDWIDPRHCQRNIEPDEGRRAAGSTFYDLGASVLVAISVVYFGGWIADKFKPAPRPQCLVERQIDNTKVQRWRDCTPAELDAML